MGDRCLVALVWCRLFRHRWTKHEGYGWAVRVCDHCRLAECTEPTSFYRLFGGQGG